MKLMIRNEKREKVTKKEMNENKKKMQERQLTPVARVKPCQTHRGQGCQHKKRKKRRRRKTKMRKREEKNVKVEEKGGEKLVGKFKQFPELFQLCSLVLIFFVESESFL